MSFEHVIADISLLNAGTILTTQLHREIAVLLIDFVGLTISQYPTFSFSKQTAWGGSHISSLEATIAAHSGLPLNNLYLDNAGVPGDTAAIRVGDLQTTTFIKGIYQVQPANQTEVCVIDALGHLGSIPGGSITAVDQAKLDGIENNATNNPNAVLETDTSTSAMQFVDTDVGLGSTSSSDTLLPSQLAVKTYVDTNAIGLMTYNGGFNADTNVPDLVTPPTDAVERGDCYTVTDAGTAFFSENLEIGDTLIAEIDDPTLLDHWTIVNKNIDFTEASIKSLYEANPNTEVFTTAEKAKLAIGTIIHSDVPAEISTVATKGSPVGADLLIIEDTEDSNNKKSISLSSLPVTADVVTAAANFTLTRTIIISDGSAKAVQNSNIQVNTSDQVSGITQLDVDNIRVDGSAITATSSSNLFLQSSGTSTIYLQPGFGGTNLAGLIKMTTLAGGSDKMVIADALGYIGSQALPVSSSTGISTDNRLALFDGIGGNTIKQSTAIIDTSGAFSGITQLNVDNLRLDGNTISSTNVNGVINITPNGTGGITATGVHNVIPAGATEIVLINSSGELGSSDTIDGADSTAIHDNVASEIAAITVKATPVTGDFLVIEDSAAANVKKHVTVGTLPFIATGASAGGDLNGTYPNPSVDDGADSTAIHDNVASEISAIATKAAPVDADFLIIEDSAGGTNIKKSITIGNLPFPQGSGTDERLVRWSASGNDLQDSTGVSLTDADIMSGITQLNVDNLRLDGNTISSTNTDGPITIAPDGAGAIDIGTAGAAARAITVGNQTGASALVLHSGTGGIKATGVHSVAPSGVSHEMVVIDATGELGSQAITLGTVTAASNMTTNTLLQGDGGFKGIKDSTITVSNDDELSNVQYIDLLQDTLENTWYGYQAGNHSSLTTADKCVSVGDGALSSITEGTKNTAVGWHCCNILTIGGSNCALGDEAMEKATEGVGNCAIGVRSLNDLTTGNSNIGIGRDALSNIETGDLNIGIGTTAGVNLDVGTESSNIMIANPGVSGDMGTIRLGQSGGFQDLCFIAGIHNVTPGAGSDEMVIIDTDGQLGSQALPIADVTAAAPMTDNTLIVGDGGGKGIQDSTITVTNDDELAGVQSISLLADADNNTAFGYLAGNSSGGIRNVAFGSGALSITAGTRNTAIGADALLADTSGFDSVAIGANALISSVSGDGNIAIGSAAGSALTTNDSNNIMIGNSGNSGDNNVIKIGTGAHTFTMIGGIHSVTPALANIQSVIIDQDGQLGSQALPVSSSTGISTDNRLALFDGIGGKTIKQSTAIIDTSGALSGITQLNVDNLRLDGNTISSTNTDGPITIAPDGAGAIDIGTAGAAARAITVGNQTGASALVLHSGTGGIKATGVHSVAPSGVSHEMVVIDATGELGSQAITLGTVTAATTMTTGTLIQGDGGGKGIKDSTITVTNDNELGDIQYINILENTDTNTQFGYGSRHPLYGIGNTSIGHQANAFRGPTFPMNYSVAIGAFANANVDLTGQTKLGQVAIGYESMVDSPGSGNGLNTAVGYQTLKGGGERNCAFGYRALTLVETGVRNVAIGANALESTIAGSENTAIGYDAGTNLGANDSNNINIGNQVYGEPGDSGTLRINGALTRAFIGGIHSVAPAAANTQSVIIDEEGQLGSQTMFPLYISSFQDTILHVTTSSVFQTVFSVSTPSLVVGTYQLLVSYGFNHDAVNSDFESRITFDTVILGDPFSNGVSHKQEPKDSSGGGVSGSTQQLSFSQQYLLTVSASGAKVLSLDYRTDVGGADSAIWDANYTLMRLA